MNVQKRGFALIWAVVMSMTFLLIGTTAASLVIKETQLGDRNVDSAKAYSAAQTGINIASTCIKDKGDGVSNCWSNSSSGGKATFNSSSAPTLMSGYSYNVSVTKTGSSYLIKSIGSFNGVKREIDSTTSDSNLLTGINPNTGLPYSNSESFTLKYFFWINGGAPTGTTQSFMLTDDTVNGTNQIRVMYQDIDSTLSNHPSLRLKIRNNGGTYVDSSRIDLNPNGTINKTTAYVYQVSLQYIKNNTIKLSVSYRDASVVTCLGVTVLDVPNLSFGDLRYFDPSNFTLYSWSAVDTNISPRAYDLKNSTGTVFSYYSDLTLITSAKNSSIQLLQSPVVVVDSSNTKATITWKTDLSTQGSVDWGTSAAYGNNTTDLTNFGNAQSQHTVVLPILSPGSVYHFRTVSKEQGHLDNIYYTGDQTFTTGAAFTINASTVTAGSFSAPVSWDTGATSTTGMIDYGTTTAYGNSTLTDGSATSHSMYLSSLLPNTNYHYRITASDGNNTVYSSDYNFTTGNIVQIPSINNVTTTQTSGTITWDDFAGAGGYVVERSSNLNYGWTQVGTTTEPTLTFTNTGLTSKTTYYYRVRAVVGGANTEASTPKSLTTN